MKEQSLIHVRIDYEEAIQAKKDLLSSERDFIRLLKTIKRYELFRKQELTTKLKLQNKIFPKIKLPDFMIKEEEFLKEEKPSKTKKDNKDEDLEVQLREIQERLRKLG